MKFSFATLGCPDWSIERIADAATEMGYAGVELRAADDGNHLRPDESADSCRAIRDTFAARNVAIVCLMAYTKFASADAAVRDKSSRDCISLIHTARALGCPMVRIFGGAAPDDERAVMVDRFVTGLAPLLPIAEQAGVRLVIETHDAWCDAVNVLAVVNQLPSESLAICWDIANGAALAPHAPTWAAMKSRVLHVHAKDLVGPKELCVLPGEGESRLAEGLQLLQADGYAGWVTFEWEKKWQPTIAEPEVALPTFLEFVRSLGI